jgi:hypothetical protein
MMVRAGSGIQDTSVVFTDNFRCYSMRATQRATGYGGQIDGVQTSVLQTFMYQIRKGVLYYVNKGCYYFITYAKACNSDILRHLGDMSSSCLVLQEIVNSMFNLHEVCTPDYKGDDLCALITRYLPSFLFRINK